LNQEFSFDVFDVDDLDVGDDEGSNEFPLLPLRDTVVFPGIVTPLIVGRDRSVRAVEAAIEGDNLIVVATQRVAEVQDPVLKIYTRLGWRW